MGGSGGGYGGFRRDETVVNGGDKRFFLPFNPFNRGHNGPFNFGNVDVFNMNPLQWPNPWTRNWIGADEGAPPVSDLYGTNMQPALPVVAALNSGVVPTVVSGVLPANENGIFGGVGTLGGMRRSIKSCSTPCVAANINTKSNKRGCGCGGNNEHSGGKGYSGGFGLNHGEHSDEGFHGGLHFPLGGWYGWGAWPWGTYGDFVGHHGNAVPCHVPQETHHLHNSGYDEGEHRVGHGHGGYNAGEYGGGHHGNSHCHGHGGYGGGYGGHGGYGGYGHGGHGHGGHGYGSRGGGYRNDIIKTMFGEPFLPEDAMLN